ncbi:MAG: PAS domain S-box protein, partial [Candidatus Riflemargulisbacteria bacterium]
MEENRYRQLLSKAPFGYAYHQLVTNDSGIPIDYIFLEVNEAFEQLTGLKAKNIINKKVTEVIPTIKEGNFDWIKTYGDITINKQTKEFEHFFIPLNKWYKITATATDTEHFTAIFTDITASQLITKKLQELIDSTAETIDYTKICETIREISGARYVIFNKFEPNGKDFTTMAIGGLSELKKITEMLGFEIIKKQWKYDPDRESKIQNSKTTEFKSLSDLTGTVIPESIANLIQHTFNLSEFYLIKTMRNHLAIGDCTLFFKKGSTFLNKELTETFVDAIGITLSRIANEEVLTNNENRYIELAEQSETITWEINKSGTYTFISPFIEKLLGYTPEEVIEKMHFYDLHPENNEGVLLSASLQLFINKIPINNLENALLTKSKEIIWVSTTCLPVFDGHGELTGYRGTDTNITDKKLNEQSIKDKTTMLQQITDNMNDVIFLLDLNLNFTYISPSIEKLTGFSPEIYKTRKTEDRFTENSRNKIYALFSKELENEKDPTINKKRIVKAELEEYTSDGRIIWISVHISFIYNEKGVLAGFIGSSRDITERKLANESLQESEKKHRLLIENSHDIIYTLTPDGIFTFVSPSWTTLLGHQLSEVVGHSFQEFFHPDDLPVCINWLNT